MDTTLSRPPAGQLLDGRYRVEAWLAHGGMATVYLGTDTRLDRKVALKIAHPELAGDEEFIRRFMGEARSVARLSSPHVVAVYDQGTDGQFLYLAMEYVPGRTLRELLRERGRLGPREALDIIEGVLAGLAAAHEAGLVHRDVKPENVLLTTGNLVKVADFGLARAAAAASRTKSGMIIGTAAYLAPEQVSKSSSDARTDVYAAGIMLFELLTGTQPHTGGSPLDVAYKHVNDVVPAPSSLVPGLPPALDALVALATSRDPDRRPADAGQFLHAIIGVRRGLPIAAPQPRGQHAAPHAGYPGQPDIDPLTAASWPDAGPGSPRGGTLAPSRPDASPGSPRGGTLAPSRPDASPGSPGGGTVAPSWPDASPGSPGGGTVAPSWPDASPGSPAGGLAALPWAEAGSGPANGDRTAPGAGSAGHQSGHAGLTIPPGGAPVLPPPWSGIGPGGPASADAWPGGEHGGLAAAYPWPGEPSRAGTAGNAAGWLPRWHQPHPDRLARQRHRPRTRQPGPVPVAPRPRLAPAGRADAAAPAVQPEVPVPGRRAGRGPGDRPGDLVAHRWSVRDRASGQRHVGQRGPHGTHQPRLRGQVRAQPAQHDDSGRRHHPDQARHRQPGPNRAAPFSSSFRSAR